MKTYIRNWSFLVVSDVLGYGFGFFSTILLARNLAPSGYGAYNVLLAVSAMASIVANFGMAQVLIREIARNPGVSGRLLRTTLPLRSGATLLAVAGVVVYFLIAAPGSGTDLVLFTGVVTVAMAAWDLAESFAFGKRVMKYSALINSIFTGAWFLLLWLAPGEYYSVLNVLILFSAINVLKTAVYFVVLARYDFFVVDAGAPGPERHALVKASLPYLWLWGLTALTNQLPIVLLASNSGSEQAGIFSIGLRLIIPLTLLMGTATRAAFPNLAKLSVDDPDKFRQVIAEGVTLVVFFGSLGAAVISLCSSLIVPFLFGKAYVGAVGPLNLLVWFGMLYSVDVLLGTALSSSDRQNALALLATVDTVISLPILYYGSLHGALVLAGAKLVVELVLLSYHWVVFKKILGTRFNPGRWLAMTMFLLCVCALSLAPVPFGTLGSFMGILFLALIAWTLPASPFHGIWNMVATRIAHPTAGTTPTT